MQVLVTMKAKILITQVIIMEEVLKDTHKLVNNR